MKKRRHSKGGVLARVLAWTLVVVLALGGLIVLFAAPLSGLLVSNALESRGLGPVSLKITRLDPGGISVRQLKLLGGAASVDEVDVTYGWREVLQGRLEAIRIDGLEAKITWAADGKISIGAFQVFPRTFAELRQAL